MKKFLVTFLLLVFGISMSTSAQEATKRITKQPKATENPLFVAGPWTESSNTISENFEGGTFPPAGWAKLNPDNGTGWALATVGVTPIPGWNGGTVINAPGVSGTGMAFMSYQLGGTSSNDSWLITPQLLNVQAGDSLKFKLRKFGTYADNLDIKISTTVNNNTTAFTINVATIALLAADSGWTDRAYEIGSLVPAGSNIYIAFREHVTDNLNDGAAFFIDEVRAGGAIIPVEFGSFYSSVNENTVVLNWSTATETNNLGFEVERKSANGSFVKVGFVSGKGTTTNTSSYSYSDKNVQPGKYSYRLRQIDLDGTSAYSNVIETEVIRPNEYALNQNYPNPFNPSTKLSFSLAVDAKVTVKIFNVLGQEISTLINGNLTAGSHNVNFNAAGLQSGVYFAKMEAKGIDGSSFSDIKKMILNK